MREVDDSQKSGTEKQYKDQTITERLVSIQQPGLRTDRNFNVNSSQENDLVSVKTKHYPAKSSKKKKKLDFKSVLPSIEQLP